MIIDGHLHLWDLATGDYTWNTPDLGPVHATFTAADAAAALRPTDVASAVLVQAADTAGDTQRMIATFEEHSWVAGVVAWVPLEDPQRAAAMLDRWQDRDAVVGIRQLLHEADNPTLLDSRQVRLTLAMLAGRGIPLDIPDAWPRLWPAVTRLIHDMPELTVVVDHLGKPALNLSAAEQDSEEFRHWRRDLQQIAGSASVVAKLSGLGASLEPGTPLTARMIGPMIDVALEAFGADRLMFGSDWPVSLTVGSYAQVVANVRSALDGLSQTERDAVLGGTAARVYRVPPDRGGLPH
jgi:L-fuconolactonase